MKRIITLVLFVALLTAVHPMLAAADQNPLVLNLWPGTPPGEVGNIGPETYWKTMPNGDPIPNVGGRPVKWLTNVSTPTITVYRPPKDKDTGVSMIICPGGGLTYLAWDVEGEEVAEWLNSIGVTGIILKYRVPRRPDQFDATDKQLDEKYRAIWYIRPLQDAQRAMSLVRSKAAEWGLDPHRIGMIGFSAGAGLTSEASANFHKRTYDPVDDIDKVSCRPDFAVVMYNGGSAHYSKEKDKYELNSDTPIHKGGPPMFIVSTSDDTDKPEIAMTTYLAAKQAGISAELHIYALGGHDFGLRPTGRPNTTWPDRCVDWMRSIGLLKPAV